MTDQLLVAQCVPAEALRACANLTLPSYEAPKRHLPFRAYVAGDRHALGIIGHMRHLCISSSTPHLRIPLFCLLD